MKRILSIIGAQAPEPKQTEEDPRLRGMSVAFRRHHADITRGIYPARFIRVMEALGDVRGRKIIEIGGAEGTMSSLMKKSGAARVLMVEREKKRYDAAVMLHKDEGIEFENGNILQNLHLLEGLDTLVSLRCLYHVGPGIHDLFKAVQKSKINMVLLQGNETRRTMMDEKNHPGAEGYEPENQTWGNILAIPEGMERILTMYGFKRELFPHKKKPIMIGRR